MCVRVEMELQPALTGVSIQAVGQRELHGMKKCQKPLLQAQLGVLQPKWCP